MSGNTATTEDLLNLEGIRRRIDSYSFDLLDSTNTKVGEVRPIRGKPPVVSCDTTRSVYRTMTNFEVDADQQQELQTVSARVRPVMTLQNGDTFNLGVFLFGDASRPRRSWGLELAASLLDPLFVLGQPLGRVVAYEAGTVITDAAVALASEVIGSPMVVTPSTIQLGTSIAWKVTDSRVTIINELMRLLGYLPVFFDNDGDMVLRPVPLPPFGSDVEYEAGGRIVKDSILEIDDLLKAPNRYVVIDSGSSTSPITATFDLPASAPNSITNRGFPVVQVLQLQGLADTAAAANAAAAAAYADVNQFGQVQFASTHDPRHDTFNIVTLLGSQYRESSWSVALRSGALMSHMLRAVYQ